MAILPEIKNTKQLSLDYIAGLITGEGSFFWITQNKGKQKVPVFQLRMHYNDRELVFAVRNSLKLKEPIYEYKHRDKNKPSLIRHYVQLMVRKTEVIKEKIIPAFEGRLYGLKREQFNAWKAKFLKKEKLQKLEELRQKSGGYRHKKI